MALTDNLIAYYKLDDANDAVASYNLTNNNGVLFSAAKCGNGANFGTSNTNRNLIRNDAYGLTYASATTVSFWAKTNTQPTGTGTANAYMLNGHFFATNPGNYRVVWYQYTGGVYKLNNNNGIIYTHTIPTTSFDHLVMTWDHSGNIVHLWVNGADLANSPSFSSNYSAYTTAFTIGNWNNAYFSNMIIDEVGYWSRILTSAEIGQLYNSGTGLFYRSGSFISCPGVVLAQPQMLLMFM